ncbi:MAG: branched-chain amino acid transport system substrate-binding protein [Hyphomicrobiales bacterium]|jgi:branched-chain amino acid transport system substrate-binding protein|nr:branched-chain amino acid transport system substrate-binding protein [Hyphomicrobiales bacterium]
MHKRSLVTRRTALLAGAGAIAAPFVITSPGFGQTGPIKLAGLVSLTGSGSPFGPNSRIAHTAVVEQVNAAGGLLGRKLEYLAEDDATNAEAGVRGARKLIDVDKVSAIMSVWASAVGSAVLPLCWENKVMLLGISAADTLAELPHQGYFVRTQPHTVLQARQFAKFILAQNAKSAYLIMPQTPFTESVFKTIREEVEPKGVKITSAIIDNKKTSFRSEIDEMVRANPDIFMMGGYLAEDIVMAKDLFRANYKGKVMGFAYGITPAFIEGAGKEAAEGIYSIADPSPALDSSAYAKLKALVKRDTLDTFICQAYDHANLAILSMAKGKDATGTGIRDNIRKVSNNDSGTMVDNALDGLKLIAEGKEIKYSGASGPCKFADNGNIIEVAFRTAQVKDGKLVEVKG